MRGSLSSLGAALASLAGAAVLIGARGGLAALTGSLSGWPYASLVGLWLVAVAVLVIIGFSNLFRLPWIGKPLKALTNYSLLLGLGAFLIAPFVWMVIVSLHKQKAPIPELRDLIPKREAVLHPVTKKELRFDPGQPPPDLIQIDGKLMLRDELPTRAVTDFHPENYGFVLFNPRLPVGRFFFNSVFVTVSIVLAQLFISSLAAYGFARLRFRGREVIFALFLGSMMFAGTVTTIPVYLMIKNLGWLDTYWALIVPGVSSAFTVFLLRQFFLQVPNELDEAARIDGAGEFRIYWNVMLPLSRAALATAAAFTFFGVWTDFFGPLIFTSTTEMRTLEVGLAIFKNSYGGNNWPLQMAAAIIVMAPLLLVFLFTQRYFTKGIMLGSIK